MFRQRHLPILYFNHLIIFLFTVVSLFGLPVFGEENKYERISIEYYGEIGCSHCDTFLDKTVPKIEKATGINLEIRAFDILDSAVYDECLEKIKSHGDDFRYFPVLFIGNNIYQGSTHIEANLIPEIEYFKSRGVYRPKIEIQNYPKRPMKMAFLPVVAAGLIDGVNPCAFTTLIFFIAFLSYLGRSKKEILTTGISFTFAVFLTYFFIGLGLLNVFRSVVVTPSAQFVFKLVVTAAVSVLFAFNIRDIILIRNGSSQSMTLQLPGPLKKLIHGNIRNASRSSVLFLSALAAGFFVSILELACTGQIYFPTIAYITQTESFSRGVPLLLIYNVGFIVPLGVVFLAVFFGISSDKLSDLFKKHMFGVKLAMGIIFALLGIGIWVF